MVPCIVIVQVKLVLHVPSAFMNASTKECLVFTKIVGIWLSTKMHSATRISKYSPDINTRKTEMLTNCERKDTESVERWVVEENDGIAGGWGRLLDNTRSRDPAEEKMKRFSTALWIYSPFQLCAFH